MSTTIATQLDAGTSAPPTEPLPVRRKLIPQGRTANRAYGIMLDEETLYRWGSKLYQEVRPRQFARLSKEELRDEIEDTLPATLMYVAREVYSAFPTIPRLRRNIVLLDPVQGTWLLVLKDNSSPAAFNVEVRPEDVQGAITFLGLEDENRQAKWYKVRVE
ncbi:hypothetical protein K466DRAFT_591775 [Polyporus arcularius HHB13444]|uniref:Uncharacterized protein n=1 Tax=Polyporus arcularius HHB13444 TaxID=1314778 RepID=A0A5C3NT61_9APHY|nr:hypothetical protein K466DRAFT_591775 [Polyporus arcularius HHB13444]